MGIAVSGGPDSLALLLLAHAALPGQVQAATVDHGLRPESADEAAMVASLCEKLGIAHRILPVEVERGNLQARARKARYTALAEWADEQAIDAILTAHHADDQAETLVMRLNRGSGMAGLAGVRGLALLTDAIRLVRPLLNWRKSELEKVCADAGVEPASDPSNENESFDRVRIRRALATSDWLDPLAIAQSAHLLAEAQETIGWMVEEFWNDCVFPEGPGFRFFPEGTRLLNIEVIRLIIAEMGSAATRSEIGRLHDRLFAGHNASLGGILAVPTTEEMEREPAPGPGPADEFEEPEGPVSVRVWRFHPEPARTTH
ncbi:tRNA lysidine(34) synthetase TilS [Qipengyuania marisflavi]|uniref:tRNA(Ile)-lysidine synthase n=1 Tax=Qipengyuania marisflavi TaxID=2486356 RepID=A0A5S3P8Q0_9SPHN|nr:tRNA lysidine(34) synthetase TilS [Qipengyuania marisflavi]TMM47370.1 tRNA lysidine(34) synthetase TilS [Qipengyuania marisflavi]